MPRYMDYNSRYKSAYLKGQTQRSRPFNKRTRTQTGRYPRSAPTFQSAVTQVLMKRAETKYFDIGVENVQLYHNLGETTLLAPGSITSIANWFNPWSKITNATLASAVSRFGRIGDRITPRGMSLDIYMANKYDRPSTMVRIIVAILPKNNAGSVTTNVFNPFQSVNSGALGNNMLRQADKDKGVKFIYDKIHRFEQQGIAQSSGPGFPSKEQTKVIRLWINRKNSRDIIFDSASNDIVNKPLAIYAIPYEQYSTIETDNVTSLAGQMRMYYKDV